MENILDKIVRRKLLEVAERTELHPMKWLESTPLFERHTLSMRKFIRDPAKSGIIAEIKRKSPSKGVINNNISVADVAMGYRDAGASAISVLTDRHFFGGSEEDLKQARENVDIPILRKEFIIDEYQILESRSIGADAVLLIAAVLSPLQLRNFARLAHSLSMEVLLEVHGQDELDKALQAEPDLIGVNNRNLKTFDLSVDTSRKLSSMIPDSFVKVSESGIESPAVIQELRQTGYEGFLIGQTFMQATDPGRAAKEFIGSLKKPLGNG
ncbi:MAG: indole-3-glycerol phosphate synthase TrpC [Bacteroidetes bacterium]|nr:indole-3-glycerol phosphate synthase TrpC [Bacteroidota bacterium]